MRKLLVLVLAATILAAGCGGSSSTEATYTDSSGKTYYVASYREAVNDLYAEYKTASDTEKVEIAKELAGLGISPEYGSTGEVFGVMDSSVQLVLSFDDKELANWMELLRPTP